jgi:hypothetical protein
LPVIGLSERIIMIDILGINYGGCHGYVRPVRSACWQGFGNAAA